MLVDLTLLTVAAVEYQQYLLAHAQSDSPKQGRRSLAAVCIALGQRTRAGIEDNLWFPQKGVRMSTIQMIERDVRIAKELGRAIATPEQARQMLKIGVTYQSTAETLANLGLLPNRHPGNMGLWSMRPTEGSTRRTGWMRTHPRRRVGGKSGERGGHIMSDQNVQIKAEEIEVARVDQIPPGSGSRFTVKGIDVAIFNVDGSICAISDTCPHAGGALGMGKLDGKIVTCPVHGMKFDVTTGCFAGTSSFGVRSYPLKVSDGKILVAVE